MITLSKSYQPNSSQMSVSKYHVTDDQMQAEQVMVEAAKADPAKFEPLYRKYYEQIFRYIYQRMDDKDAAFDVTSQVFLKALTNLPKYKFKGVPFSSWLYRIAFSETNNYFNKNKARRTVNIDTSRLGDMLDEMDDNGDREEQKRIVLEAIGQLAEADLQIIEMRFFEKRSFKEVAEILDITENNAKVKTYRILDKIRKRIGLNE